MSKSLKVTLDEIEFEIPALNLGQLQEVSEAIQNKSQATLGLSILKIALQRAKPTPNLEDLSPTLAECGTVVEQIMTLSGLQKPDANPPSGAAT